MNSEQEAFGAAIVCEARRLIGTPFRHAQRVPGVGVDCIGLLYCIAVAVGRHPTDCRNYQRQGNASLLREHLGRYCVRLPADTKPVAGDFLLVASRRYPSHVLVYVGDDRIVHALPRLGVLEEPLIGELAQGVEAIYRMEVTWSS
jgi:cell wall-associated NlpC family hydrolase